MKRVLIAAACLAVFFVSSAYAEKFDCQDPQFGKSLSDLDADGYFIKQKEQDGITYYIYSGPCKAGLHERLAPVLMYGFINGRLYARIAQTFNDDFEIVKQVAVRNGGEPKTTEDGDWIVMAWDFPEKSIKLKIKYNKKTNATKSVMYYEPLRAEYNAVTDKMEDALQ